MLTFRLHHFGFLIAIYGFRLDPAAFKEIHNGLFLRSLSDGLDFKRPIKYKTLGFGRRRYLNSRMIFLEGCRSAYIRMGGNGNSYLTIRETVISDQNIYQFKIFIAWLLSYIFRFLPRRFKPILLYEKKSSKYEESASMLFERLVEYGYREVKFILSKPAADSLVIDRKYRNQIIIKGSLRHYIAFFLCKTFISTESPAHAIDLRVANPYALEKLARRKFDFVFLQHGVSYMISLGAKERRNFRPGKIFPDNTKVVVSSQLEADEFRVNAGFLERNIYVTGLPKFDHKVRFSQHDKIMIMPTWRPWDYNLIALDVRNSSYYRMCVEIVGSVPDELKEKVILMPHPLIMDSLRDTDLSSYLTDLSYEHALRSASILITDYSSIAYDAFNRGCVVVFWWKEKDECMAKYGGDLMLTEENAFGPVCFCGEQLRGVISEQYGREVGDEYFMKFREIVNDFGSNSTDLLIEKIIKDGLLRRRRAFIEVGRNSVI
ncbi:CDP-glycerol glycerophosphotransferase family protein [Castellaniella ginsengisoli]|uniref:CDP-glycerol glycerophosphotransferase family protein n=2 Tax=Castellaniella ginsengisoli TaxID=546114 RepID=A0AB39DDG1_9BURK